jgi:hypothetical protein
MTLPINVLQSLISHTRAQLHYHYINADMSKNYRNHLAESGEQERAEREHRCIVIELDKAKKLATVQKALKKELAHNIHVQRCERYLQKARRVAMEVAGEVG